MWSNGSESIVESLACFISASCLYRGCLPCSARRHIIRGSGHHWPRVSCHQPCIFGSVRAAFLRGTASVGMVYLFVWVGLIISYTVLPQADLNSRDSRNCCKKLSISDGGDRKKLRRLSSMARHFFSK